MLHEMQYDTLVDLLGTIRRQGKGKKNTMYCLHRCLQHAKKSRRITLMPDFPEEHMYQVVEPVIKWLPSERQEATRTPATKFFQIAPSFGEGPHGSSGKRI